MAIDLAPGERIIWHGQPKQGFRLAPQDAFAVPFAAFWLFMVSMIFLFAFTGEMKEVDPLAYVIMPVFMIAGLYMLFGRFLVDRAARRRIFYYLTTERAFIEAGLFRPNRRSVNLAATPEIRFQGRRNGRGTVQFGSPSTFGMIPPSWPGANQFLPPAFDDIEDAERVYNLALKAQREAKADIQP
ncbi:hypothetical protein [Sphingopyxis sp.]|uniref:hypothetical protein n=1 Tax=Sphingopyxis sp. TaxID=1908224 RepID=UPI0026019627|nr:hypothetical protein [Sphingopyxis sp.]MCW0198625.1 hypothetical protein [Sphingopyxis sp.]